MTNGQQKATALLARLVWGRTLELDDDVTLLGELVVHDGCVSATLSTPSSNRFEVTVRHLGDRRSVAA